MERLSTHESPGDQSSGLRLGAALRATKTLHLVVRWVRALPEEVVRVRPVLTFRFGMRRPWLVIGLFGGSAGMLVVAWAPSISVVVAGWCLAQLFFNALLAALVAVLPDRVPTVQRIREGD